jgi:hypothetical protein
MNYKHNIYYVEGKETIGNIKKDIKTKIVADNKAQAIFLLNKDNIMVDKIEYLSETNKSIESTLL